MADSQNPSDAIEPSLGITGIDKPALPGSLGKVSGLLYRVRNMGSAG